MLLVLSFLPSFLPPVLPFLDLSPFLDNHLFTLAFHTTVTYTIDTTTLQYSIPHKQLKAILLLLRQAVYERNTSLVSGRARSATRRPNLGNTDDRGYHHRGGILNTQLILEDALDIRFRHFSKQSILQSKGRLVIGFHGHVHMH